MKKLKAWHDSIRFTTDWEPPRMPDDLISGNNPELSSAFASAPLREFECLLTQRRKGAGKRCKLAFVNQPDTHGWFDNEPVTFLDLYQNILAFEYTSVEIVTNQTWTPSKTHLLQDKVTGSLLMTSSCPTMTVAKWTQTVRNCRCAEFAPIRRIGIKAFPNLAHPWLNFGQ